MKMIPTPPSKQSDLVSPRIVVIGSRGMLGSDLVLFAQTKLKKSEAEPTLFCPSRTEFDFADEKKSAEYLNKIQPNIILNAAAYAKVDLAETERVEAFKSNVSGPAWLSQVAHDQGAKLIHFSTDQVFDGTKGQPYLEADEPNPLNYYAETKWLGEQAVLKNPDSLVLRVQWLFGRTRDRFTPIKYKSEYSVFSDQFGAPTWTMDLSDWVYRLIQLNASGLFHAVYDDFASWEEIFRFVCEITGWKVHLNPMLTDAANLPAKRPKFSVLSNLKLRQTLGLKTLGGYQAPLKEFLTGKS